MTEQFKLRLDEQVIRRLDQLARKYGRRSGNEVGAEVIMQYLDFWEYAESAKHAVLAEQRAMLADPLRVPVITDPKGTRGRGGKK